MNQRRREQQANQNNLRTAALKKERNPRSVSKCARFWSIECEGFILHIITSSPPPPKTRFLVQVQCCFTSTETIRSIRDGWAQDGHADFHTAPELWIVVVGISVALRPQKP